MDLTAQVAWTDLGILIARGQAKLERGDILAIASILDFSSIKPDCLPFGNLSSRNTKTQKEAERDLCFKLWGLTASDFMRMEQDWLASARRRVGSTKDDDKIDADDLVTPTVLARIYSTAYLYHLASYGVLGEDGWSVRTLCDQALHGLNIFIANACLKGYTRAQKLQVGSGQAAIAYNLLRDFCLPVGASGKFLPDPKTSLPEILLMFQRDKLRPEVYRQIGE